MVEIPHGVLVTAADPGIVINTDATDEDGHHTGGVTVLGTCTLTDVSVV